MNNEEIECNKCGGSAPLVYSYGTMRSYLCSKCGHKIDTLAHYVDSPIKLNTESFKATVTFQNMIEARKGAIKIRKIIKGFSNFDVTNYKNNLPKDPLILELGIYSKKEMEELVDKANAIDLNLQFTLLRSGVPSAR